MAFSKWPRSEVRNLMKLKGGSVPLIGIEVMKSVLGK